MRCLMFMLLPLVVYGVQDTVPPSDELDTVRLGSVFPVVVWVHESGVTMSHRSYGDLDLFVGVQDKELMYYRDRWDLCVESKGYADKEIEERKKIADFYRDRSVMYRDGYMELREDFNELHGMLGDQHRLVERASRVQMWRGAGMGLLGGVVVGMLLGILLN